MPEAPPATTAEPQVASQSPRRTIKQNSRDVVLSMLVVGLLVFGLLAVRWRPTPDPVRAVDAAPVAQAVADAVNYPVLFPKTPEGWRATTARYQPSQHSGDAPVWFNGWVTPDDEFVAVIQARATNTDFIKEETVNGRPVSDRSQLPASLAGWDAYVTPMGDQRSLVKIDHGVATIVTGTPDWDGLQEFISTLAPVPPSTSDAAR